MSEPTACCDERLVRTLIAHARNVVWARRSNGEHMDEAEHGDALVKLLDAAKTVEDALRASPDAPRGVYGEMCRDPKACAGKGYCPRDPACSE